MTERRPCPVCTAVAAETFLTRPPFPVHQNMVVREAEAARATPRGSLSLAVCRACGFVFNQAFDPALIGYDADYDNTQTHSPSFQAHVDARVDHLVNARGVRGARIVEVGCGKGLFLQQLIEADPGNRGLGFDTSYVGPSESHGGRLRFERTFYGPEQAHVPADVVVCRHVIEHVGDPVALLRAVRQALAQSPGARVFFETPCVGWILDHQVVWDFFYEHCSYFTAESLTTAFTRAGFAVASVEHVFGGQYLWLEATLAETPAESEARPGAIPELATAFAEAEHALVAQLRRELETLAAQGGVALWGAGAKGVTLANLVDPEARLIRAVIDLNPNKQGNYVPGTGHPIVAPEDAPRLGLRTAVLMNPNYREENLALIATLGLELALVDLHEGGRLETHD